ncbi:MAG: hypothetical protein AAF799_27475 [Myxococcota bacterium]
MVMEDDGTDDTPLGDEERPAQTDPPVDESEPSPEDEQAGPEPEAEPEPEADHPNFLHRLGLRHERRQANGCVLVNNTGRRIGVCPSPKHGPKCSPFKHQLHGHLVLAPFGERQLAEHEVEGFDTEPWEVRNLIEISKASDQNEEHQERRRIAYMAFVRLWILAGLVFLGLEVPWLGSTTWYWLVLAGIVLGLSSSFAEIPAARVWAARAASFWVTLTIGVGLPLAGDWLVGGGVAIFSEPPELLVGRMVQLIFVSIAAVLPAMLYYLFDRQQVGTLRESFFRNVIELEPKILTIEDAKSAYGGMVAEVYGSEADADPHVRFTASSRLPILIATLALTSGWLLVLPPLARPEADLLLLPTPTPVSFGFLGAYFFSIGMIVRRYTRSDLKPKTYGHVTVRLLLTVVLVWALSALPLWTDAAPGGASPYLLALSFMVGIVPDTGLMVIRRFLNTTLLKVRIDSMHERLPLSRLDGITLYEQARLAEEGIEDVQNLVYYHLVELVLQTRIPLYRLIDWVDQGILIMHLGSSKDLETLRAHGIRNASDLNAANEAARRRGKTDDFLALLGKAEGSDLNRLQIVYDALQNDEWFENILLWRERARLPGEHVFTLEEMFLSHREILQTIGISHTTLAARKANSSGAPPRELDVVKGGA